MDRVKAADFQEIAALLPMGLDREARFSENRIESRHEIGAAAMFALQSRSTEPGTTPKRSM